MSCFFGGGFMLPAPAHYFRREVVCDHEFSTPPEIVRLRLKDVFYVLAQIGPRVTIWKRLINSFVQVFATFFQRKFLKFWHAKHIEHSAQFTSTLVAKKDKGFSECVDGV